MSVSGPTFGLTAVSKIDWVVTDCLYRVATGLWSPGYQLPVLRSAAELWGVNELTCLRAYRRLMDLGLVESRQRSGYFVADAAPVTRLARHQADLQHLYDWFAERVRRGGGLSVLGAARALTRLTEARVAEQPECAFVECTQFQAAGHAQEVYARLRTPCLSLTTADILHGRDQVPSHVRTLLTTHFHYRELLALRSPRLTVSAVPIELAPDFVASLTAGPARQVVVLALSAPLAKSIASDLADRVGRKGVRFPSQGTPVDGLGPLLDDLLNGSRGKNRMVVLSTGLWSNLPEGWKDRPDVRPFVYQIRESAWPDVADAAGMPMALTQARRISVTPGGVTEFPAEHAV